MNFVAIDVETANHNMASICQIGLVEYRNGVLSSELKTYVDPEDYFDNINISIHGINEFAVKDAPTFLELADTLRSYLEGAIVVSHMPFDRTAIQRATQRYGVIMPECTWLDSAKVARRTWKECAQKGYGLANLCMMLGYEFKHHDALEDAKAAAHVLLAAIKESELDLDGWLRKVRQPINPTSSASSISAPDIKLEGNPEGTLYGEILVFTGSLEIPRRQAADMADAIGCRVTNAPTKETTMLVVGDQDIKKLAGHTKSSKHRRAEDLIAQGIPIRILRESDFEELVKSLNESD